MIKNVKFYVNNNQESLEYAKVVKEAFYKNGFNVVEKGRYDLGIAIGGDGSFLRMIKKNRYNGKPLYVGINTGHLGFFQEVKVNEHNNLIHEIKNEKYNVVDTIIQKTVIATDKKEEIYHTLNEIRIEEIKRKLLQADIYINGDLLENYAGDGIMISTSSGSTAHNLSYDGAIVDPDLDCLQITSLGALSNGRYKSLRPSAIFKADKKIEIIPKNEKIVVTTDGISHNYKDIESISSIGEEKIKCLKLSKYSFANKIYDKMLNY